MTTALNDIQHQLTFSCNNLVSFSYLYNSSACSKDSDNCLVTCPHCRVDSVAYLHSPNCTKEIFLLIHTACVNFSIPGACIDHSKPRSLCCLVIPSQSDIVIILAVLVPICVVICTAASVLTAYAVKTR